MSTLADYDQANVDMFESIKKFFRYHKNHDVGGLFDDAYYERVAEALKKRIDHELKYLHEPSLK